MCMEPSTLSNFFRVLPSFLNSPRIIEMILGICDDSHQTFIKKYSLLTIWEHFKFLLISLKYKKKNGRACCHCLTRDSDAAQINTFPQYHSFSGRYLIKPIPLVGDGEVSGKNS